MRFSPRVYQAAMVVLLLALAVPWAFAQESTNPVELPITEDVSYTAEEGDTLDSIGALFDVDTFCLAATNGMDESTVVRSGDVLLITVDCPNYDGATEVLFPRPLEGALPPDESPATETETTAPTTQEATTPTTTTQTAAPDQQDPSAGAGQAGSTYVVQYGDTLDTIAQEFNVSQVSLRVANDLLDFRGSDLMPGTSLVIPSDGVPYGGFPALTGAGGGAADPTLGTGGGGDTYIVQPRDTLDTIAQEFNISVVSLRLANDLMDFNARNLQPGTVLVLPTDGVPYGAFPAVSDPTNPASSDASAGSGGGAVGGNVYVLQPRDTLDQVAAEYNVLTSCLLEANGVTNSREVYPGQAITIPSDCPPYLGGGSGLNAVATPAAANSGS